VQATPDKWHALHCSCSHPHPTLLLSEWAIDEANSQLNHAWLYGSVDCHGMWSSQNLPPAAHPLGWSELVDRHYALNHQVFAHVVTLVMQTKVTTDTFHTRQVIDTLYNMNSIIIEAKWNMYYFSGQNQSVKILNYHYVPYSLKISTSLHLLETFFFCPECLKWRSQIKNTFTGCRPIAITGRRNN